METNPSTNDKNSNQSTDADNHLRHGEREETAFSQPDETKDENGAGGRLGIQDQNDIDPHGNSSVGGAGSSGSAATNSEDTL
ncbi:MAG TPA: hypothetical protein VF676_00995 [Flavobacterium sp.]|jgi:hypothetical protein